MPRRDDDGDSDQEGSGLSRADAKSLAAQVVRLALFHEYRRQPLKREVIVKTVLAQKPRSFDTVFERAQKTLRSTFGMELVELRAKQKGDVAEMAAAAAETQRRKSKGKGKKRARQGDDEEEDAEEDEEDADAPKEKRKAGTKNYILRSTLAPELVAAMATPRPLPFPQGGGDDEEHLAELEKDSGSLIRWEKGDGTASGAIGMLGVRTVILCLVLCLGRSANDDQLHALLRRLNLTRDTVLPYVSEDGKEEPLTLDKYLDLLTKQHYLEKAKMPNPTAEGHIIEWRWGSREAEFSENAAAAFIERIFINEDESDPEEDVVEEGPDGVQRRITPAEARRKKRRTLRQDLERAAGGALMGQV